MAADFTYEMYGALLDAGVAHDVPFLTVREYLSDDPLPGRFVVLRHDVDRKPENALDFARLEAERGIASTYYFRTVDGTFDPPLIREVRRLGHEVGYHYEDVDRADGDVAGAHRSFEANLERLRAIVPVDTVCMHGRPLSPHDNRDMWAADTDFCRYGLAGEAYLSMDFSDVSYYSDTGRTWRDGALKVKDTTTGADAKEIQVESTPELLRLVRERPGRYCVLAHPDRWADDPIERVAETAFDTTKNVAKYGLQTLSGRL